MGGSTVKGRYAAGCTCLRNATSAIIKKRTQAGLLAARARGRKGGRPKALTGKKLNIAQDLYKNKENSIADICKTLKISRATLYRSIKTGERDE